MRNERLRIAFFLGASVGALAFASPSLAQTKPAAEYVDPTDIIVTARRIEERLQDVPISIQVFSQSQLSDRNITSGTDLTQYTPSLTINNKQGSDNTTFSIRGFSAEGRTTASVGVYFADVVSPRGGSTSISTGDGAGPGYFFDLQNVQVLKGPQGTLFGRNTTGGAILFTPQKPTRDFGGYVEGSYGNYDMRRIQAALNVPLGENVRMRVAGEHQKRDGYLKNISGIGPSRYSDINYVALRASLVADLTEDLENYTILSYSRSRTNGQASQLRLCNGNIFPFGPLICDSLARVQAGGDYAVAGSVANPRSNLMQWQAINTTTWNVSDTLTVKNIVSYSRIKNGLFADLFGVQLLVPTTLRASATANIPTGALAGRSLQFNNITSGNPGTLANQGNFTEELQLQGTAFENRLQWQVGAYTEQSKPKGDNTAFAATFLSCANQAAIQCDDPIGALLVPAAVPAGVGSLTVQRFRSTYKSYGVFGQGTFKFTEKLSFTGGIRYTWDTSTSFAQNLRYTAFRLGIPARLQQCANPTIRPITQPFTDPAQCNDRRTQKSKAPTWVASLEYKPVEDLMIYGKYSRGYRQGSTNPLGAGGFNVFRPEKVDTYEAGLKTSWRGAVPGFFNVAAFYNDFTRQQFSVGLALVGAPPGTPTPPPNAAIINIGKSRIYGFELETGIRPFKGLSLDASYAYINSKLQSVDPVVFPPGSFYNLATLPAAGGPLLYSPKNKFTGSATYTLPLDESIGALSVGLTYTYTSKILSIYTTTPNGVLGSYDLINLNVNWRKVAGGPFDLSLFVTNLTKEKYDLAAAETATVGYTSYIIGEPRMYGARLRFNF